MANWGQVGNQLTQGFEIGQKTGGKMSGVGQAIAKVADRLRSQRETGEAMKTQLDLLGQTEDIKLAHNPEAMFKKKLYDKLNQSDTGQIGGIGGTQGNIQVDALGNLKVVDAKDIYENQKAQELLNQARTSGKSISDIESMQKAQENIDKEQAKPYGDVEAGLISKSEILSPEIDKLVKLLEDKDVYEGAINTGKLKSFIKLPAGASRISAFGEKGALINPIRRALTAGPGREAGLILQKIKVLAFGEGGKNLTENEKAIVFAYLSPQNKTEKQWAEDLKFAENLLKRKAELVTKGTPKNVATQKQDNQLEVGAYYENAQGERKRYLGNNQWGD